MFAREENEAFTILELIVVVVISAVISITVALFLQKSTALFKQTDETAELLGRIKVALDRLRRCTRHSISSLSNFRGTHAALERTETLYFVTDFDQDATTDREQHFVWYDRYSAASNPLGTNKLLHVWKRESNCPVGAFDLVPMPPDMTLPSFATLIDYLRNKGAYNAGGPPTIQEGWEILLDAPYPNLPPTNTQPGLPVYMGRWRPPPPTGPAWPVNSTGATVPPPGIAFNIDNLLRVLPGANPTYTYPAASAGTEILNDLCIPVGRPFYRGLNPTNPPSGSVHCQVYLNIFVDNNLSNAQDSEEASFQFLTSLNLLLLPSPGISNP